ncbi:ABC transporter permease [Luxibacter massiliensis]|uniref:ABC transporter permease n=1 Tax=Luxibacter massiliensis TaxID=2219695 RepID=UPI000F04B2A6|nr:ABC transporter permease [Luxibacter massiliensis]
MTWPFENDTRNAEKKLAVRSLNANKQRNFLIGIIIFAASFLLTFSTILVCNATIDTQIISRVDNTQEVIGVIFGIAIVLLFTAGIAIKNIMYISVLQRTREFAQLRTIGATYRQIKLVIHNERKQLSWKYILGGLFFGFLCNCVLPLGLYLVPSVACALFSGAFIWFIVFWSFRTPAKQAASLSPMAALRIEERKSSRNSRKSTRITPSGLAKTYFSSNRKKASYTLLSLVLSGVLMFGVFSVMSAIDIKELVQQSYYEDSSVYLLLNSTASENSTSDLMKNSPFTQELKAHIENIPGVIEIYPSKKLNCEVVVSGQSENKYKISINSIVGTSSFEVRLVEGGMPYSQNVIQTIPIVINRVSPYYERTGLDLKLGDHFSVSVNTGASMKETDFSVCGFIENKDTGSVFYTAPEYLDFLAEVNCDLAWYICTEDVQTKVAVEEIKTLVTSDDRISTSVFSEELSEYQGVFHNAKVVVTALMFLICLFAFINLLNTCITNTVMRRHDYALLEAAGMTKAQIQQIQNAENRIYFAGSFIGSCVVGIPLGFFLCSKIAEIPGLSYISYQFPWLFLILYLVLVFTVHAMVTAYQKRILMRQSVVERIKTGE